jgi:hypothetical protein
MPSERSKKSAIVAVVVATITAPIQERVEFLGSDLSGDQRNKDCRKDRGADEISEIQRHRDGVAAGLAERGRGDLNDPEAERDFRDFA